MPSVLAWVQGLLAWGTPSPSSSPKAPQLHWGPHLEHCRLPRKASWLKSLAVRSFFQAKNIHLLLCLKRQEKRVGGLKEKILKKGMTF